MRQRSPALPGRWYEAVGSTDSPDHYGYRYLMSRLKPIMSDDPANIRRNAQSAPRNGVAGKQPTTPQARMRRRYAPRPFLLKWRFDTGYGWIGETSCLISAHYHGKERAEIS